jgi:hypothetical protein
LRASSNVIQPESNADENKEAEVWAQCQLEAEDDRAYRDSNEGTNDKGEGLHGTAAPTAVECSGGFMPLR